MEPTVNPPKHTGAEQAAVMAAAFAARDESMRLHFSDLLTIYSVAHDPETITYADALAAVVLNYQNLLDGVPAVYDAENAYVPSANGNKSYWIYLYDLVELNGVALP